jgi:hypothetical protein
MATCKVPVKRKFCCAARCFLSLYKAAKGQTHGAPIADDVLPPEQALWQCSNRRPGEMEMCLASTG